MPTSTSPWRIVLASVMPIFAASPAPTAVASPVASASCANYPTRIGTKSQQAGEFCSHKPGYAAAYRHAGFKCKADGHLTYR